MRIGTLVLVLTAGWSVWMYRAPIMRTASTWFGPQREPLPVVTDTAASLTSNVAIALTDEDRPPEGPDRTGLHRPIGERDRLDGGKRYGLVGTQEL